MVQVFIVSFVVSFLGSIPPGTINITTMQYAIRGHKRAAFFFALAITGVEFLYAGFTVRFQMYLSSSSLLMDNFLIITAVAMILLGVVNLITHSNSKKIAEKIHVRGRNAFAKGMVVGLLNPLVVPFWLAVTAYLQNRNWVQLDGSCFWVYISGISIGTFTLLLIVRYLGVKYTQISDNHILVHIIPGLTFIGLGLINFFDWLF